MSESPNRIHQITVTPTLSRQTPQNDFGHVMARTVAAVVQTGAGVAGGLTMGNPVLSAAVSGVMSTVSAVTSVGGASGVGPVGAGVPGTTGPVAGGGRSNQDAWDLMEAQKLMNSDQQRFNAAYLDLQNALQKESREFNAISNIMKVRHDSAKAAINNIR